MTGGFDMIDRPSKRRKEKSLDVGSGGGFAMPLTERQQMAYLLSMTAKEGKDDSGEDVYETKKVKRLSPLSRINRPKNKSGETQMHIAATKGDLETIKHLIRQGADVNCRDNADWTPLHEACNHGHYKIAKILLRAGAHVKAVGLEGDTPLHDASANAHLKIVLLLLRHGADPHQKNDANESPVDVADGEEIEEALRNFTSDMLLDLKPTKEFTPVKQQKNERYSMVTKREEKSSHGSSVKTHRRLISNKADFLDSVEDSDELTNDSEHFVSKLKQLKDETAAEMKVENLQTEIAISKMEELYNQDKPSVEKKHKKHSKISRLEFKNKTNLLAESSTSVKGRESHKKKHRKYDTATLKEDEKKGYPESPDKGKPKNRLNLKDFVLQSENNISNHLTEEHAGKYIKDMKQEEKLKIITPHKTDDKERKKELCFVEEKKKKFRKHSDSDTKKIEALTPRKKNNFIRVRGFLDDSDEESTQQTLSTIVKKMHSPNKFEFDELIKSESIELSKSLNTECSFEEVSKPGLKDIKIEMQSFSKQKYVRKNSREYSISKPPEQDQILKTKEDNKVKSVQTKIKRKQMPSGLHDVTKGHAELNVNKTEMLTHASVDGIENNMLQSRLDKSYLNVTSKQRESKKSLFSSKYGETDKTLPLKHKEGKKGNALPKQTEFLRESIEQKVRKDIVVTNESHKRLLFDKHEEEKSKDVPKSLETYNNTLIQKENSCENSSSIHKDVPRKVISTTKKSSKHRDQEKDLTKSKGHGPFHHSKESKDLSDLNRSHEKDFMTKDQKKIVPHSVNQEPVSKSFSDNKDSKNKDGSITLSLSPEHTIMQSKFKGSKVEHSFADMLQSGTPQKIKDEAQMFATHNFPDRGNSQVEINLFSAMEKHFKKSSKHGERKHKSADIKASHHFADCDLQKDESAIKKQESVEGNTETMVHGNKPRVTQDHVAKDNILARSSGINLHDNSVEEKFDKEYVKSHRKKHKDKLKDVSKEKAISEAYKNKQQHITQLHITKDNALSKSSTAKKLLHVSIDKKFDKTFVKPHHKKHKDKSKDILREKTILDPSHIDEKVKSHSYDEIMAISNKSSKLNILFGEEGLSKTSTFHPEKEKLDHHLRNREECRPSVNFSSHHSTNQLQHLAVKVTKINHPHGKHNGTTSNGSDKKVLAVTEKVKQNTTEDTQIKLESEAVEIDVLPRSATPSSNLTMHKPNSHIKVELDALPVLLTNYEDESKRRKKEKFREHKEMSDLIKGTLSSSKGKSNEKKERSLEKKTNNTDLDAVSAKDKVTVHEHILACGPKNKPKLSHGPGREVLTDMVRKKHKRKSLDIDANNVHKIRKEEQEDVSKSDHPPLRESLSLPSTLNTDTGQQPSRCMKGEFFDQKDDQGIKNAEGISGHLILDNKKSQSSKSKNQVVNEEKAFQSDQSLVSTDISKVVHQISSHTKQTHQVSSHTEVKFHDKKDDKVLSAKVKKENESTIKGAGLKEVDLNMKVGLNDTALRGLDHMKKKKRKRLSDSKDSSIDPKMQKVKSDSSSLDDKETEVKKSVLDAELDNLSSVITNKQMQEKTCFQDSAPDPVEYLKRKTDSSIRDDRKMQPIVQVTDTVLSIDQIKQQGMSSVLQSTPQQGKLDTVKHDGDKQEFMDESDHEKHGNRHLLVQQKQIELLERQQQKMKQLHEEKIRKENLMYEENEDAVENLLQMEDSLDAENDEKPNSPGILFNTDSYMVPSVSDECQSTPEKIIIGQIEPKPVCDKHGACNIDVTETVKQEIDITLSEEKSDIQKIDSICHNAVSIDNVNELILPVGYKNENILPSSRVMEQKFVSDVEKNVFAMIHVSSSSKHDMPVISKQHPEKLSKPGKNILLPELREQHLIEQQQKYDNHHLKERNEDTILLLQQRGEQLLKQQEQRQITVEQMEKQRQQEKSVAEGSKQQQEGKEKIQQQQETKLEQQKQNKTEQQKQPKQEDEQHQHEQQESRQNSKQQIKNEKVHQEKELLKQQQQKELHENELMQQQEKEEDHQQEQLQLLSQQQHLERHNEQQQHQSYDPQQQLQNYDQQQQLQKHNQQQQLQKHDQQQQLQQHDQQQQLQKHDQQQQLQQHDQQQQFQQHDQQEQLQKHDQQEQLQKPNQQQQLQQHHHQQQLQKHDQQQQLQQHDQQQQLQQHDQKQQLQEYDQQQQLQKHDQKQQFPRHEQQHQLSKHDHQQQLQKHNQQQQLQRHDQQQQLRQHNQQQQLQQHNQQQQLRKQDQQQQLQQRDQQQQLQKHDEQQQLQKDDQQHQLQQHDQQQQPQQHDQQQQLQKQDQQQQLQKHDQQQQPRKLNQQHQLQKHNHQQQLQQHDHQQQLQQHDQQQQLQHHDQQQQLQKHDQKQQLQKHDHQQQLQKHDQQHQLQKHNHQQQLQQHDHQQQLQQHDQQQQLQKHDQQQQLQKHDQQQQLQKHDLHQQLQKHDPHQQLQQHDQQQQLQQHDHQQQLQQHDQQQQLQKHDHQQQFQKHDHQQQLRKHDQQQQLQQHDQQRQLQQHGQQQQLQQHDQQQQLQQHGQQQQLQQHDQQQELQQHGQQQLLQQHGQQQQLQQHGQQQQLLQHDQQQQLQQHGQQQQLQQHDQQQQLQQHGQQQQLQKHDQQQQLQQHDQQQLLQQHDQQQQLQQHDQQQQFQQHDQQQQLQQHDRQQLQQHDQRQLQQHDQQQLQQHDQQYRSKKLQQTKQKESSYQPEISDAATEETSRDPEIFVGVQNNRVMGITIDTNAYVKQSENIVANEKQSDIPKAVFTSAPPHEKDIATKEEEQEARERHFSKLELNTHFNRHDEFPGLISPGTHSECSSYSNRYDLDAIDASDLLKPEKHSSELIATSFKDQPHLQDSTIVGLSRCLSSDEIISKVADCILELDAQDSTFTLHEYIPVNSTSTDTVQRIGTSMVTPSLHVTTSCPSFSESHMFQSGTTNEFSAHQHEVPVFEEQKYDPMHASVTNPMCSAQHVSQPLFVNTVPTRLSSEEKLYSPKHISDGEKLYSPRTLISSDDGKRNRKVDIEPCDMARTLINSGLPVHPTPVQSMEKNDTEDTQKQPNQTAAPSPIKTRHGSMLVKTEKRPATVEALQSWREAVKSRCAVISMKEYKEDVDLILAPVMKERKYEDILSDAVGNKELEDLLMRHAAQQEKLKISMIQEVTRVESNCQLLTQERGPVGATTVIYFQRDDSSRNLERTLDFTNKATHMPDIEKLRDARLADLQDKYEVMMNNLHARHRLELETLKQTQNMDKLLNQREMLRQRYLRLRHKIIL